MGRAPPPAMQYEQSTQKATSAAPAPSTESATATTSNTEAQEAAGLAAGATASASTDDLVATVLSMGSLGVVVLDALPTAKAIAVAAELGPLEWVIDWLSGADLDEAEAEGAAESAAEGEAGAASGEEAASAQDEEPGVLESIAEWIGLGTGETEDGWALAKQTADNLKCVAGRLDELKEIARYEGATELVAELETAAVNLRSSEIIAGGVLKVVQANTAVDATERLCHAAIAAYKCDLKDDDAAAVFDEFFAAAGSFGEVVADYSGAVGTMLKPLATLGKMIGEYNIFTAVKEVMQMQGWDGPNGALFRENCAEGLG